MTKFLSDENWKLLDERIKREDEDRWLSSRYASSDLRRRLIALYALNLELAKIRTIVSEPGIGAIRFQWWRDVAEELKQGKRPRDHDVVKAIASAEIADKTINGLVDGHQDAFEANDRALEPEVLLMRVAAGMVAPAHAWGQYITLLAPAYAAARRGETKSAQPAVPHVAVQLRPAISHSALRHIYVTGKKLGPLRKRFAVMRAMANGRA